ncbi:NfeD family protein [Clostridium sp. Cult2]|uniref:NfeD family protein n=1 Tax=Clostridium sp. Cult2 TaxID=2079003 RepID=UPI001F15D032|nr:nodulation protein NfeD [Clostridium sp. Cult2]MCF6466524.1 Nodulation efficiency protein D (NfeD) [Clostridium sp. Cult2]
MKKTRILILIFLILIFLNGIVFAEDLGDVYVIPVNGEINRATYNFLRNKIDEIVKNSPKAIIFEIDTYGGLIDEAEKIKNLIINLDIPTISFVNNKAESAGVLITISGEKIVMAESSTIGSAETIPDTEKVLSMWRSFLRDVAQFRGRNPEIVEAMADRDVHIDGISEKGKLLNLTSKEALKYGIADFISNDYDEILSNFNIQYSNIVKVEESMELKVAKILSSPYISTLLLTIGFVGLVIEIFTPGFGVGGTISIVAFGLFFGGNIIAGNSQWTSLAIFVTGLILLVIEAIVPGFGLPGISGIILVILGTILAMGSLSTALMSISIAIIITAIITMLLVKYGHRSPFLDKIVLTTHQKDEEGYLSSFTKDEYLGKEGITISELRPSGIIEIDGKRLDALSDGTFIPKQTNIEVVRVEGSKIIVRRV